MNKSLHVRIKIFVSVSIMVLMMMVLTGCSSKNKVPGKSEVMKYVEELCPNEDVDYEVSNERGKYYGEKRVVYNFSSNDRDLEFEVVATAKNVGYEIMIWNPVIYDSYHAAIRVFYQEEIEAVFDKYDAEFNIKKYTSSFFKNEATQISDEYIKLQVDSYDAMLKVVDFCYELDTIYSQERAYNTQSWMDENPLATVNISLTNITGDYYQVTNVEITGDKDYDALYDELTQFYKQALYDGLIYEDIEFDDSEMHKSELLISINGKAVERDDLNGDTSVDAWNPEKFVAKYDYETGTYYLPLNPRINEERNPELLQLYIECAGGDLGDYSKSVTKFTIGSDKYVIDLDYEYVETSYCINDFTLEKNGDEISLSVLEKEYDAQHVFWISIEDMARIFRFDYSIDEDNDSIDLKFR